MCFLILLLGIEFKVKVNLLSLFCYFFLKIVVLLDNKNGLNCNFLVVKFIWLCLIIKIL